MDESERSKTKNIFFADTKSKEDINYVTDLVKKYGGIEYSMNKAKDFIESAKEKLNDFPESDEKRALLHLADFVIERRT